MATKPHKGGRQRPKAFNLRGALEAGGVPLDTTHASLCGQRFVKKGPDCPISLAAHIFFKYVYTFGTRPDDVS